MTDLKQFDLPITWERKISQIINDNIMLYEPWVETAKDYNDLRSKLKRRGYSRVPMGAMPLLDFKSYAKAPVADTSSIKIRRTMIRKTKNGRQ